MDINNINIKKNKAQYIIQFELDLEGRGDFTKNWTTLYQTEKGNWTFNNVIYRYDPSKKESLDFDYGNSRMRYTPEPHLYFDLGKTDDVIETIYASDTFARFEQDRRKLHINSKYLYHKKSVEKRRGNLKRLILSALKHGHHFGCIGAKADFYVSRQAMVPGEHARTELPGGDEYRGRLLEMKREVETSIYNPRRVLKELQQQKDYFLKRLQLYSTNTDSIKQKTHIKYDGIFGAKGENLENKKPYDSLYCTEELSDATIYYDEIYTSRILPELIDEILKDQSEILVYDYEYQEAFWDPSDCYDGYSLEELLMHPAEDIFESARADIFNRKKIYAEQIESDYNMLIKQVSQQIEQKK